MIHTLFRDALLLMLVVLVACLAFMIKYMADPTPATPADIKSPGSIIVTAVWPEGDNDVDIWLNAPGEEHPVSYRHKGGKVWDLLRDDLGTKDDPTPLNYENAYTRGEPPGEYTINAMCYRCFDHMPIDVTVTVQEKEDDGRLITIVDSVVHLTRDRQELTASDFTVGPDMHIDPTTLNTLYKPLYTEKL